MLSIDLNTLFSSRLVDISLGSIIGAIGGWILYNQSFHFITKMQIRKAKVILKMKNLDE